MERKRREAWAKFWRRRQHELDRRANWGEKLANGKKCDTNEARERYLRMRCDFADKRGTHWVGLGRWRSKLKACFVLWQFCMGEEEGDFGRGGGTPLLVFYYGRLIE